MCTAPGGTGDSRRIVRYCPRTADDRQRFGRELCGGNISFSLSLSHLIRKLLRFEQQGSFNGGRGFVNARLGFRLMDKPPVPIKSYINKAVRTTIHYGAAVATLILGRLSLYLLLQILFLCLGLTMLGKHNVTCPLCGIKSFLTVTKSFWKSTT